MTTPPAQGDIASTLAALDQEERAISAQRRELHAQIDNLYLNAPLDDVQMTKLNQLENQARDVSEERSTLHREINVLRSQAGQLAFRRQSEVLPTLLRS